MRRVRSGFICMLLCMAMLLSCIPTQTVFAKTTITDSEMKRIESYKLFNANDFETLDQIITDKELYGAIQKFLKPYGSKATKKFNSCVKTKLNTGRALTITDVFRLIYITAYSADSTGKSSYLNNKGKRLRWLIDYGNTRNKKAWHEIFDNSYEWITYNWDEPYYVKWAVGSTEICYWGLEGSAFYYCNSQTSQYSGKLIYEAPWDTDFTFLYSLCSKDTAMRMLGRLYEIGKGDGLDEKSAVSKAIVEESDDMRRTILTSESRVTGSGTVYYVSASMGDDENDGLSEQSPWKTLNRTRWNRLNSGDVVLFKRGDIWRGEYLACQEGVVYSAYGTGAKPAFYGNVEEPNDESYWELYDSDDTGKKIWKYYKKVQDVGGIIFNGDEYADRIYAWWNDKEYVCIEDASKKFSVKNELSKDMTFCSLPDFTGLKSPFNVFDEDRSGDIYFRCDAGNPATICKDMHFECSDILNRGWSAIIIGAKECVIDNIAVKYFTKCAISTWPLNTPDITVQNCEVGFGGNALHSVIQNEPTKDYMLSGDGIYGICNGAVIRNNYVHDVDGAGITWENGEKGMVMDKATVISNNLVERCGQGMWLHTEFGTITYREVSIKDNMILHIGEGYVHGCWCELMAMSIDNMGEDTKKLVIENNTIYKSKGGIFDIYGNYSFPNNNFYGYEASNPVVIHDGMQYYVDTKKERATLLGSYNLKKSSMTVAGTISYNGKKYKVKAIAKNALSNTTKKSKITISASTSQKKNLMKLISKAGYKGSIITK